ncbi:MAG: bifunctional phosphoglucose/phosphomannose isomerase [Nitrososphaerota archaeon]|nr:bifunctional phosphoglucose/phosphomannose isomerase [Candidatus Bathyarchaeota archaeon]MCX8162546.1 bifunctional phosphoglucose/phosphomannose isomerase [Candidatus Bathyarchaeota archaeon]MDW8062177.1 bifunctional phosphoglucose/phosphomannose isomerase [Nitrososphaerota archaeon]
MGCEDMALNPIFKATLESADQYRVGADIGFKMDASRYFDGWIPNGIVFTGMGGSAIVGGLASDWLKGWCRIPVYTVRGYYPPGFIDEDILVFVLSYSGDTEEALSIAYRSFKLGARVVGLSSGGLLEELCYNLGVPHIKVLGGYQPRAALGVMLSSTLAFLETNILKSGRFTDELEDTVKVLEKLKSGLAPSIPPEEGNIAKQIAYKVLGKLPVVYGWESIGSVAFRWRTQFNENSKVYAVDAIIPEAHHNEVVTYQDNGFLPSGIAAILLRSMLEPEEIKVRMEITRRLLHGRVSNLIEVWSSGSSRLACIASLVYVGDMASLYLAELRGVDPGDISIINRLKAELDARLKFRDKLRMLMSR